MKIYSCLLLGAMFLLGGCSDLLDICLLYTSDAADE